MAEEKPLHVRVAEALGCKVRPGPYMESFICGCPTNEHADHFINREKCHSHSGVKCDSYELALYDTDWSATGPLIEKYGITINMDDTGSQRVASQGWFLTLQFPPPPGVIFAVGETYLIAACNLILALKEAGKL